MGFYQLDIIGEDEKGSRGEPGFVPPSIDKQANKH